MFRWHTALIVALIVACFPLLSAAQGSPSTSTPPLPESLIFGLVPDGARAARAGRGARLEITQIVLSGSKVTALATMHGTGRDGCRILSHAAEGSFDGSKLVLQIKVASGDNLTCPHTYELVRGSSGKFAGRYTRPGAAGNITQE